MIKKIVCLHPNIHSIDEFYKYFCLNTDKLNVELRWDTKTPEYIIRDSYKTIMRKVNIILKAGGCSKLGCTGRCALFYHKSGCIY